MIKKIFFKFKNKKDAIFLIVLGLVFLFFIAQIATLIFYRESWVDEQMHLFKSMSVMNGDFVPFKDIVVEYPPLYLPVYGFFQNLFGPSFYVGRAVTSFLYVIILFLMFLIVKKLTNKWWALLSIALLSSNFLLVGNYVSAGFYSIAVLPLMLVVWIETLKIARWRKSLFSGIALGLMMLARTNMLAAVLVYFAYLIFIKVKLKDILISVISFVSTVVIGYIPIVLGNPALAISHIFSPFFNIGPLKNLPPSTIVGFNLLEFVERTTDFLKEYYAYLLLFVSSVAFIIWEKRHFLKEFMKKEHTYVFVVALSLFFIVTHYFYWRLKGSVYYANYFMPFVVLSVIVGIARFLRREKAFAVMLIAVIILNFSVNVFRTDVFSSPFEETDIQRVERGAQFIRENTEENTKILTFDNSIYHVFISDRKTFAPLINRNFFYFPGADKNTAKSFGFYNFEMLKEWLLEDSDYVALQEESWRDMFTRTSHWGDEGGKDDDKIEEVSRILDEQYELIGTVLNVYPRKYTEGNDGGTLLLYKRLK